MEIKIRESFDGYHGKVYHEKSDLRYYHREDGPALIYDRYVDGKFREFWYYYNKQYLNPKQMPLNLFLAYCKWEYMKNAKY